jgi:hypothetical protein
VCNRYRHRPRSYAASADFGVESLRACLWRVKRKSLRA